MGLIWRRGAPGQHELAVAQCLQQQMRRGADMCFQGERGACFTPGQCQLKNFSVLRMHVARHAAMVANVLD